MSSYVIVELDTTAPHIDIYAPRYTTRDVVNTITIEADETLAEYQDIYIIDSIGVRHNLTFNRDSDSQYVGEVRFNNISTGIVQVFARMKDEVDNFSNIASATIEVKNTLQSAVARISDKENSSVDLNEKDSQKVNIKDNTIIANIQDETMNVSISEKTRRTIVSDITMKENLNESQ